MGWPLFSVPGLGVRVLAESFSTVLLLTRLSFEVEGRGSESAEQPVCVEPMLTGRKARTFPQLPGTL